MSCELTTISCLRDVNDIIRLHNQVWNHSTGIIDLLENSTECILLRENEHHKIVGYLFIEADTKKNFWEINDLAIDSDFRKHGYGRTLMTEAMNRHDYLKLNAKATDVKLIEFYRKLGFKTEAVLENYYAIDQDALRMVWRR